MTETMNGPVTVRNIADMSPEEQRQIGQLVKKANARAAADRAERKRRARVQRHNEHQKARAALQWWHETGQYIEGGIFLDPKENFESISVLHLLSGSPPPRRSHADY